MRVQRLLLVLGALGLCSLFFYSSDSDSYIEDPRAAQRDTGALSEHSRALILYHFHPCGRNVTVNIGVFFSRMISAKTALFSGVDYIFVYGSFKATAVREVHRFENSRVFETPLLPADLSGFAAVAEVLWDKEQWLTRYARIMWLNAGTIGPLTSQPMWIDVVSGMSIPDRSMASTTVISATVSWEGGVHPQSNFISCPTAAAKLLLRGLYAQHFRSKNELIQKAEVGAGRALLANNYRLYELTRRVFITMTSQPLNKRNTFLEIVPNVSQAVFYKLNDRGYRIMASSVKEAAAQLSRELGLSDAHVSKMMSERLGVPLHPSPLRMFCTLARD
jgi:hypothetical protein